MASEKKLIWANFIDSSQMKETLAITLLAGFSCKTSVS